MAAFHKEGRTTIAISGAIIAALVYLIGSADQWWSLPLAAVAVLLFGLILYFFRSPIRVVTADAGNIIAPADGKIVAIEEVDENEFLGQQCLQVSIFMSPLNVHVNWNPVRGKVIYHKHHKGKYLVAWHPKSSTENERTTVVLETPNGQRILVRQIAGAMARRIVNYLKVGDEVKQGDELGFIKFGSRVDVLFPLSATIKVKLDQKCAGNHTVIAEL